MEELEENTVEHMLREIFEKDSEYRVEVSWDRSAYVAILLRGEADVTAVRHLSMFDAVSGLHTYVMNS